MITPEEFPYITGIHVNDCYTYKDFDIELYGYKPFSHLILTGKNGSGKTTILTGIHNHLAVLFGIDPDLKGIPPSVIDTVLRDRMRGAYIRGSRDGWKNGDELDKLSTNINKMSRVHLYERWPNSNNYEQKFRDLDSARIVFTSFKARRQTEVNDVETPTKESDFVDAIKGPESSDFLNKNFQQYLVNKRVNQAFDKLDNNEDAIKDTEDFFDELTSRLRIIFDDEKLSLRFIRERYETPIVLSDGREIGLKHLPEGFSGLLRIILDLLIRVDLVRKQVRNNDYNPSGIVLIDEPEIHLHLELQEQVLPLLTDMFPNIQFIVATQSPAVVASIKNATIFDLTTKETRNSEETVGRSYAELTTSHFGLDNNYSTIADEIVRSINEAANENQHDPEALKNALEKIAREQGAYLSPTLQVEMELLIAKAEAKQAVVK